MLEPVVTFFDKLVDQFSWRRLAFTAFAIIAAVIGLLVFESYTGHFKFGRIDKATDLLNKLIEQRSSIASEKSGEVVDIHNALLRQLNDATKPRVDFIGEWMFKALCAAAPWLVFSMILRSLGKFDRNTLGGMILIVTPICIVAGYIPTFDAAWINYAGYPLGVFAVLFIILSRFGSRPNAT